MVLIMGHYVITLKKSYKLYVNPKLASDCSPHVGAAVFFLVAAATVFMHMESKDLRLSDLGV